MEIGDSIWKFHFWKIANLVVKLLSKVKKATIFLKASRRLVTGKAYVKGSCFLTATCFRDLFQKDLKPLSRVP